MVGDSFMLLEIEHAARVREATPTALDPKSEDVVDLQSHEALPDHFDC